MNTPLAPPAVVAAGTRSATVTRNTAETQITVRVDLDGSGRSSLSTGIGFFDHMLDQIARHGLIDLDIQCQGDLHIDGHHTVEDVGITLGQAVAQAVGDKKGIRRYGHAYVPLDEALSRVVVDFSGRPGLVMNVPFTSGMIGTFDSQLTYEFFHGFVNHALVTLHIDNLKGVNAHHQCETVFKAFARVARRARTRSAFAGRDSFNQGFALTANSVAVVDYGMGNLRSVSQAVQHAADQVGVEVRVTSDPEVVRRATRVVLPGQGAMPDCMRELRDSGLQQSVLEAAASKPLFGVCVGMQMLLSHSHEGPTDGLGLIPGEVVKFDLAGRLQPDGSRYKVPQMGWNQVHQTKAHPVWTGVPDQSYFYFVHSFYARPSDARHSAGEADYGAPFTAAIARDNIFATQFHPEKSADHGLQLYRNFLHWNP